MVLSRYLADASGWYGFRELCRWPLGVWHEPISTPYLRPLGLLARDGL